jgi:hypothetical protein
MYDAVVGMEMYLSKNDVNSCVLFVNTTGHVRLILMC